MQLKSNLLTTLVFIIFSIVCVYSQSTNFSVNSYRLVWEDNFNANVLDETNNWEIVVDGKGGGNKELQYYSRKNISVGKEPQTGESCLIITAKKQWYKFKHATSGRVQTRNKMTFRYGKLEARIKVPKTADGLWPAFWMLGHDYPQTIWPKCGEIDIMEMGHSDGIENKVQDRLFNGACHWGEEFNYGKYPNYAKASTNEYCLQKDFHLYTLIWDQQSIKMYLDLDKYPDNKPYFEMPINGKDEPDSPARYFNKPYFIIFNLAVGGNFPQIYNINKITALKTGDAEMYVDYVRLYQLDGNEQQFTWRGKVK